jgi:beta-N-acetylhexosaminidase
MKKIKAVILGCQGTELTVEEREFFRSENPLGLILFKRNIQSPEQVKALTDDFRMCVGRPNAPILIDQEGGRVQRLKQPYWVELPPAKTYGDLYLTRPEQAQKEVLKHTDILAENLKTVGVNVDCWPCLDVLTDSVHDMIGDRCFSNNPDIVVQLGQLAVDRMLKQGIMPVIKHIPGYGRALVDPHLSLPVVRENSDILKKTDFYPFAQIKTPVWGMTAHVIYECLDKELPATLSKKVISYIRNEIGFNGFLICDDMKMGALKEYGTEREIAVKMLTAGCDAVLHCSGVLAEAQDLISVIPDLSEESIRRLEKADSLL